MSPASNQVLQDRALMLRQSREFLNRNNILEVDCPVMLSYPSIDTHIEPYKVVANADQNLYKYLHTSPEFCLKKLLARGLKDIYQISHVFRKEEEGEKHRPEFTLVEWYQEKISFSAFIKKTLEFISLFFPIQNVHYFSYKELFEHFVHIDPFSIAINQLEQFTRLHIDIPDEPFDQDTLLSLLLTHLIEPKLQEITVIYDYPCTQAALAQTTEVDNIAVAQRFEIYYDNMELANGYHELTDPIEQKRRFILVNQERIQMQKEPLPIDEDLIAAIAHMKDTCGVALGFDRLMMIRHHTNEIGDVLPF